MKKKNAKFVHVSIQQHDRARRRLAAAVLRLVRNERLYQDRQ
jgi:hypothetical protein